MPRYVQVSDLADLICRELGPAYKFTLEFEGTPLGPFVTLIVGVRSDEEVLRIETRGVVAFVEDKEWACDVKTEEESSTKTMCVIGFAIYEQHAITCRRSCSFPKPTAIRGY